MSKKGVLDLRFPAGGLVKRSGFQQQAPFTTPDCLNVRPTETIEGRERGGSRPGLSKALTLKNASAGAPTALGSGNPIRLLNAVTIIAQDGLTFWSDSFRGNALGTAWAVPGWSTYVLPTIFPSNSSSVAYNVLGGAVRTALSNFDETQAYQVDLYVVPYLGAHHGTYQIFLRMNDTTPVVTTDGLLVELTITGATGIYTGSVKRYSAGMLDSTTAFTGGTDGSAEPGWFSVRVSGTTVSCYWREKTVLAGTVLAAPAAGGKRFGFGMNCTVSGGVCLVDNFRIQYKTNNKAQATRRLLVASSNGSIYKENMAGDFAAATSTALTLASDRLLHSAERTQKLYIADNGNPRTSGTGGTTDAAGTLLDDAAVADWTALGIDTDDDVVVISAGTGATAGTYAISSIHATNGLTLASSAGATASAVVYRIERCPKIYDPAADTLTKWTATALLGQVPTGCPLIALYRDRMVLAGAPIAPHVWYMSRQGDPLDWDYSQPVTDGGRAIAGTNADAGLIGEPITALISHSDDYLIYGTAASLWIMRGDAGFGGQIDNLSRNVGIVTRGAWCRGPSGEVILLSRDGLYMLAPGAAAYPVSISREKLPRELRDVDPTMYSVTMEYDMRDRGVHIYLTSQEYKGQLHFWMDWSTKGFWPVRFDGALGIHEPTAICNYVASGAEDSAVLLGCRDGYVRRMHDSSETDDGTEIQSYVVVGPVKMGRADYSEGMLSELICALAQGSGAVDWAVRVGETNEEAWDATSFATGTFSTAGLNFKDRPRARGAAFSIKLENNALRAWSMERLTAVVKSAGKQRLA